MSERKRPHVTPLQSWLELTGTSQATLAKRLGVDYSTVNKIVAGTRSPSLALALRIEHVTGITVQRQVEAA